MCTAAVSLLSGVPKEEVTKQWSVRRLKRSPAFDCAGLRGYESKAPEKKRITEWHRSQIDQQAMRSRTRNVAHALEAKASGKNVSQRVSST